MSRFRNLFYGSSKPSAGGPSAPAATVRPPAATVGPEAYPSDVAVAAPPLPEFATEEARINPEERLVYYTQPRSPAADRFRLLRMRLKEHWKAGRLKTLLITGPVAGEGKSTICLNLATALAERGKRGVLIVEADLHHSSLAEALHLRPWTGLTECLSDESVSPFSAIRRIEPFGWHLLPAGEPKRNPTELLQGPGFARVMQQLTPCFDWILIDSAPVVPLTDAVSLRQHADACLLVVRAGSTPREAIEQTIELLEKKNILGIVLNGVEIRDQQYYRYYGTRPSSDE
jgi:capsular exopolysaccharide synthesis family protein